MLVLGLSGMFATPEDEFITGLDREFFHDSAACLVRDDAVLAAVEEERLNRVKHTNLFPQSSARACLRQAGLRLRDVDKIAFFWDENWLDVVLSTDLRRPSFPWKSAREVVAGRLSEAFGEELDPVAVDFWRHHEAHAASAFYQSGFDESLVVVVDGNGEDESVSIYHGLHDSMRLLRSHPVSDSLGHFYTAATRMLGYHMFDEYKIMGLAPYGDARRYRRQFESLVTLTPDGNFRIDTGVMRRRMREIGFVPRRADEPISREHQDFAAAVQESLERVLIHILAYWSQCTGLRSLALAGGVAQNSSMNGRILRSGTFERIFVHPASHDAGAAVGAAALSSVMAGAWRSARRVANRGPGAFCDVFWGPELGTTEELKGVLDRWADFLEWECSEDICAEAAHLLADGAVVGWADGRSEFGPRALGHRSILADPRPTENKDRVNLLIKEREGYRPFAPAVLYEHARDYFEIPNTDAQLDYMGFVVPVRPDRVACLGAVTHVDGTARVQLVRKEINGRFWRLIREFERRTGVPVLLNTSFNNHAEPIVQTADDCVACFLTTRLDVLVLGDLIARRKPVERTKILDMRLRLPALVEVADVWSGARGGSRELFVYHRDRRRKAQRISEEAYRFATSSLVSGHPLPAVSNAQESQDRLAIELWRLWQDRLIDVAPR